MSHDDVEGTNNEERQTIMNKKADQDHHFWIIGAEFLRKRVTNKNFAMGGSN